MAFKKCSIFRLAILVPKYKEKFLLERTKVCPVNRPLPKKENHWSEQKCEVLTFCSLGIEFQILPQSRRVYLPSAPAHGTVTELFQVLWKPLTISIHFDSVDYSSNFARRAWLTGFVLCCKRSVEIPEYFSSPIFSPLLSSRSMVSDVFWAVIAFVQN